MPDPLKALPPHVARDIHRALKHATRIESEDGRSRDGDRYISITFSWQETVAERTRRSKRNPPKVKAKP
jgi:hypothetical protein